MTIRQDVDLTDIYPIDLGAWYGAIHRLYAYLGEREPHESIHHTKMPSFTEHTAFVLSQPYLAWYMVTTDKSLTTVGSIYITKHREVGIHIDKECQMQGYGAAALALLRERHPGPLLANINPANERSVAFFQRHGARLIQKTYEL